MQSKDQIIESLDSHTKILLQDVIALWRGRNPTIWQQDSEIYDRLCRKTIKLGEPLLACDIVREAIENFPHLTQLKFLHAETLFQCGALISAKDLLESMAPEAYDFQAHFLYAKVCKYLWSEGGKDDNHLQQISMKQFGIAYAIAQKNQNLLEMADSGINTATMLRALGSKDEATQLAVEVVTRCQEKSNDIGDVHPMVYGFMAEAQILLGNPKRARTYYQKAAAAAKEEINSIIVLRKQLHFLLGIIGGNIHSYDDVFRIPKVGCVTGLIIDNEKENNPRFPAKAEDKIRKALRRAIIKQNIEIGFTSGAPGADLLFADEMINRGFEINMVLPFPIPQFKRVMFDSRTDAHWQQLFDSVIKKTSNIRVLSDDISTDDQSPFNYCNDVISGLAQLRGNAIGSEAINLVIWDEKPIPDLRDTMGSVERMTNQGFIIETINPISKKSTITNKYKDNFIAIRNKQEMVAILFADTVGFSKITERSIPHYVEDFVGSLSATMNKMGIQCLHNNTWGDALFMVFASIQDAASFSLKACEEIRNTNWQRKNLPGDLGLRISLHAGPAYQLIDPITGINNYYGYHISKGARIEPITPPGQVYTSETFAALASSHCALDFICDYVGRVPYAKDFGTFPIYHLKKKAG